MLLLYLLKDGQKARRKLAQDCGDYCYTDWAGYGRK